VDRFGPADDLVAEDERKPMGKSPSTMCRSVWQTPQARTASRTAPGPGSRSWSSSADRLDASTGP